MRKKSKFTLIFCLLACQWILGQRLASTIEVQEVPASLGMTFKPQLRSLGIGLNSEVGQIPMHYAHYFQKKPFIRAVRVDLLPLFCRLEEQWTQESHINIRWRIGDLDYVDYLEGK